MEARISSCVCVSVAPLNYWQESNLICSFFYLQYLVPSPAMLNWREPTPRPKIGCAQGPQRTQIKCTGRSERGRALLMNKLGQASWTRPQGEMPSRAVQAASSPWQSLHQPSASLMPPSCSHLVYSFTICCVQEPLPAPSAPTPPPSPTHIHLQLSHKSV